MNHSAETQKLYTAAIKKGLELGADIYPCPNTRLGFKFNTDEAKADFWSWFETVERSESVARGWRSPIMNEVEISFTNIGI
jgi:hypothetical protein